MNDERSSRPWDIESVWIVRFLTAIPVLVILSAGAGAIWIYFFILSLLPAGQTAIELPELTGSVQVSRDAKGVPAISGRSEQDVAAVLGYVMAQDRLWQIDYLRRASQGRLAEILGEEYLEGDVRIRTVTKPVDLDRELRGLNREEREWFRHFVRGLNTYMETHRGKLPVEFSLLEYKPEPFTETDILGIMLGLAWESSPAWKVDPVLTSLAIKLGKARGSLVVPGDPARGPVRFFSGLEDLRPTGFLFSPQDDRASLLRVPALLGGASWTVSGSKTRSGKPMLGTAVYQVLAAPGFWYRAAIKAGNLRITGSFVPGFPAAVAGSNAHCAWGAVVSPADDADLFLEKIEGDSGQRYWRIDGTRSLVKTEEEFGVKHRSKRTRDILLSDTGPLVSEPANGYAVSLRWTAFEGMGAFSALYHLNRASNGKEVRDALSGLRSPVLTVAWADRNGNHGLQTAGTIPIRSPESNGVLPAPAWTGVHDWQGAIAFNALPRVRNPSSGFTVSAGDRPDYFDYPYFMGCYWHSGARKARITELLKEPQQHSRQSFQTVQADTLSSLALELKPIIVSAARTVGGDPRIGQAAGILSGWDCRMAKDSAGAAIFGVFHQELLEEVFSPVMGEDLFRSFCRYGPLARAAVRAALLGGNDAWISGRDRDELIKKVFAEAVKRGVKQFGEDPALWAWGDVHRAVFYHPLTNRSKMLEMVYDVGPLKIGGSSDTVDFTAWSTSNPFTVFEGVTLRHVADMTNPPQVFGVSPLGISAHFFSQHYKDQTSAWLNNRAFPEPIIDPNPVASAPSSTVTRNSAQASAETPALR